MANEGLWDKALKLLMYDPNVDPAIYEMVISKISLVKCSNKVLVLSCVDEYSLSLINGRDLHKFINNAVNLAAGDTYTVRYVVKGNDDVDIDNQVIIGNKINEQNVDNANELTSEFTFDTFVVGDCNRFAHAAAVSVANNPGIPSRNPLYLWGNSGLGKTHLMKAIGYAIKEGNKKKKVIFTTCEEFTNAYIACMKNKTYEDFRNKYRNIDVLLIDDIQFLIGKEGIQLEFFNTFESLVSKNKQIVITSDKAPKNLENLDQRLTSRFLNGMMMDIQPPDFETRKAIFMNKLSNDGIMIDDEIINYVCENVTSNVRELNGAYNIINSLYVMTKGELNMDEVVKQLSPFVSPGANKTVTKEMVMDYVSRYYGMEPDKLLSSNRSSDIFKARSVAMYLLRDLLDMKYERIGSYFGGKKHTTVMNACSKVDSDPELILDVKNLKKKILDA